VKGNSKQQIRGNRGNRKQQIRNIRENFKPQIRNNKEKSNTQTQNEEACHEASITNIRVNPRSFRVNPWLNTRTEHGEY
jgi:hypothetical protein